MVVGFGCLVVALGVVLLCSATFLGLPALVGDLAGMVSRFGLRWVR